MTMQINGSVGITFPDGTVQTTAGGGGGTVTGVTAVAPLSSSGGAAPAISLTGIVPAANGGTGAASLTGILYGNGASAATAATAGQIAAVLGTTPVATATNLAGGSANRIPVQSAAGTTTFVPAPTIGSTVLSWNGSAFTWVSQSGSTLTIGTGLSGGSYDGSAPVTIALANTAVTPGTYGSSTTIPRITVDAQGRITAATQVATVDLSYQGTWNAATNTPTLADGTGTQGDYYVCNVAGTVNLGSGSLTFNIGDWAIYNGTIWELVNNSQTTSVSNFTITGITANQLLLGGGSSPIYGAGFGTAGQVLTSAGAGLAPVWSTNIAGNAATATKATNIASGVANEIPYQTAADTTAFLAAPSTANTVLSYDGTNLVWAAPTGGTATTATNLAGGAVGSLPYQTAAGATGFLSIGTTGQVLAVSAGGVPTWVAAGGTGTVTSVSVVSANGLAGTVATSTTTPAITLSTTVTGVLKGDGTAISAAAASDITTLLGSNPVTAATNLAGGAANQFPYQTAAGTTAFLAAPSITGSVLSYDGVSPVWSSTPIGQTTNALTAGTGLDTTPAATTFNGSAAVTFKLADTAVTPGIYGSSTTIPRITVDQQGRITSATQVNTVDLSYQGTWDASTNTPTLANGTGTQGDYYVCNVAGTVNFGAGPLVFNIGDWAIYNGTIWELVNNSQTTSVANFTITGIGANQLILGGGTSPLSGLGYGTAGQILTSGGNAAAPVWTTTLPIANGGTNSTATPTAGGIAYGTGTAYGFSAAGTAGQFLQSTGGGAPTWSNATSSTGQPGYFGAFEDNNNQNAAVINTKYYINLSTTGITNGVSITNDGLGNPTKVTFANSGTYSTTFSIQFANSDTSGDNIANVWLEKNGVTVPESNTQITIHAKHGGIDGTAVMTVNFFNDITAGDNIQLAWSVDNTNVYIAALPAAAPSPDTPGIILTTAQLTQIGLGYADVSSTTSMTIATGNQTFTTSLGSTQCAYTVGTRVRVSYDTTPSNFMEGVITTFSGTSMTVNVDLIGGSGTFANWNVSVAGQPGAVNPSATNLAGGGANTIVYQSATGTTAYLTNGTTGQVLSANTGAAPSWATLGTMATQNATSVAITGGTINGTTIGGTTPAAITGTTITATQYVGVSGGTF